MKMLPCAFKDCGERRIHWCDPYTKRGTQHVEVKDDYEGKVYCSFECAIYDGAMTINGKQESKSE